MMTKLNKIDAKLQAIKAFVFILVFFFAMSINAQVLQPIGLQIPGKVVTSYANGNEYLALFDDTRSAQAFDYTLGRWNGLYWEYYPGLGTPESVLFANGDYNFHSIAIFNNEIYIAAYINNISVDIAKPINHLYKWNGNQWITVSGSIASTNYGVYDMTVWNNQLIVAGKFLDTLSGMSVDNIAAFDGSKWTQLGSANSSQGTNGEIQALLPLGNRLYIAGNFTKFGGITTGNIAYYTDNNGNWGGIGSPFTGEIVQMANVGNTLYAMQKVGNTAQLRKFENSTWSNPFILPGYTVSQIKTIAGGQSELYLGGNFNYQGLVHNIAVFKNGTFYTTENRIEGDFKLAQKGTSAYIWGDFRETNTDIKYFSTIRSNAGNASGVVYWDKNNNCIFDIEEEVVANASLIYADKNGKQQFVYTNENGRFTAYLQPGVHNLQINGGKNWKNLCPNSELINAIAGQYTSSFYGLHIPTAITDISVKTLIGKLNEVSAGGKQKVVIEVKNNGSTEINGATLLITHDARLKNYISNPPASNYTDNIATYSLVNLKPRNSVKIEAWVTLPTNSSKTDKFTFQVAGGSLINSQDLDNTDNQQDDILTLNDKFEGNIFKEAISGDTSDITNKIIKYRIEYVNGTNFPVRRAVLVDTLDMDYKIKKINYTKHNPRIEHFNIIDGHIMVLDIPNANLEPREFNPLESEGIIEFEIELSKNLPHRTLLTNSAMVDFDNKKEFYSNTTQVLVFDQNNSTKKPLLLNLALSPNPADQWLTVQSKNNQVLGNIQLLDIQGKILVQQYSTSNNAQLNLSSLSTGTYLIKTQLGNQLIQVIH